MCLAVFTFGHFKCSKLFTTCVSNKKHFKVMSLLQLELPNVDFIFEALNVANSLL